MDGVTSAIVVGRAVVLPLSLPSISSLASGPPTDVVAASEQPLVSLENVTHCAQSVTVASGIPANCTVVLHKAV